VYTYVNAIAGLLNVGAGVFCRNNGLKLDPAHHQPAAFQFCTSIDVFDALCIVCHCQQSVINIACFHSCFIVLFAKLGSKGSCQCFRS